MIFSARGFFSEPVTKSFNMSITTSAFTIPPLSSVSQGRLPRLRRSIVTAPVKRSIPAADSPRMGIDVGSDRRQRRESLFTGMVMAFAHGDLAALEEGVRSDVE